MAGCSGERAARAGRHTKAAEYTLWWDGEDDPGNLVDPGMLMYQEYFHAHTNTCGGVALNHQVDGNQFPEEIT
jgi:hypothetical protein